MRNLIKLSVLCFAMFFCGTATAAVMTAGELRTMCSSKSEESRFACGMYISGYLDGHHMGAYLAAGLILGPSSLDKDQSGFSAFCIPSAASVFQVAEVFIKYMNEHPEKLHIRQDVALDKALIQYFPCKGEIKGSGK